MRTIAISWGPWGGIYWFKSYTWRICLGWVAITLCPFEIDDLMNEVVQGRREKEQTNA